MTAPSVAATALRVSPSDFVKLLGSVAPSTDHLETAELGLELAQLLYSAMDLILKEPPKWDERTWEHKKAAPTKTHREWRTKVEGIGAKVGLPVFYVPNGISGFLLSMEKGADATAATQRRKVCGCCRRNPKPRPTAVVPVPRVLCHSSRQRTGLRRRAAWRGWQACQSQRTRTFFL